MCPVWMEWRGCYAPLQRFLQILLLFLQVVDVDLSVSLLWVSRTNYWLLVDLPSKAWRHLHPTLIPLVVLFVGISMVSCFIVLIVCLPIANPPPPSMWIQSHQSCLQKVIIMQLSYPSRIWRSVLYKGSMHAWRSKHINKRKKGTEKRARCW